jgi:hypothetical protein
LRRIEFPRCPVDHAPVSSLHRRAALAAAAGLLLGLTLAGGAVWAYAGAGTDGPVGTRYTSVAEMARRAGCTGAVKAIPVQGPAVQAGDCTTPTGLHLQLRIFGTMDEATGWGSAMGEADTGPRDVLAFGPNWVARLIDAPRDQANTVLAGLT